MPQIIRWWSNSYRSFLTETCPTPKVQKKLQLTRLIEKPSPLEGVDNVATPVAALGRGKGRALAYQQRDWRRDFVL